MYSPNNPISKVINRNRPPRKKVPKTTPTKNTNSESSALDSSSLDSSVPSPPITQLLTPSSPATQFSTPSPLPISPFTDPLSQTPQPFTQLLGQSLNHLFARPQTQLSAQQPHSPPPPLMQPLHSSPPQLPSQPVPLLPMQLTLQNVLTIYPSFFYSHFPLFLIISFTGSTSGRICWVG
jgi:hypothetical protein